MRRELPGGLELDDDPARVDVDAVHAFISRESYWGPGRPREVVECAIRGSTRVVGLYRGAQQVGFARAISDGAIVAYLADVYVLAPYRGRGLGLALVREIVEGGALSEVMWLLHTADAQGLYERLGFTAPSVYPMLERRRRRAPAEWLLSGAPSGRAPGVRAEQPRPAS